MDVVVYGSDPVDPLFCSREAEFVVIVEAYDVCIKGIETSAGGEFVGSGSCSIISKFLER